MNSKIDLKEKDAVEIRSTVRRHHSLCDSLYTDQHSLSRWLSFCQHQISNLQMEMQKRAAEAARGAVAAQ